MSWEQIQDQWLHYKNQIQHRWSALTDDDCTLINGRRSALADRIRQLSGATADLIEQQIQEFELACASPLHAADTP